MKLLFVTDHCFHQHIAGVFDKSIYDRSFFTDYLHVFETVDIFCRMSPIDAIPTGSSRIDGQGLHFIGMPDLRRAMWMMWAGSISRPRLDQALKDAAAIVLRVPSELGWYAGRAAFLHKKPFMIEVISDPREAWAHSGKGPLYKLAGWLGYWRLRILANYAHAGSYVNRNHLYRLYPLRDGRPFDFISSIRLDPGLITAPRSFQPVRRMFHVISVGSLEPRKRAGDLIQAIQLAHHRGIDIHCSLVGDGVERTSLEKLCKKLKAETQVRFYGHVSDRKFLIDLLDHSDLFVLPSVSEGLPRAMLEAMARGLPAIGSRIPGVDELLPDNDMFSVGDISPLADLMIEILTDPQRLRAMSRHGVEVARQYTNDSLSPRRQRLYRYLRELATRFPS